MRKAWLLLSIWTLAVATPAWAQRTSWRERTRCTVSDYEEYYGTRLEEDYGFRQVADRVAEALYEGPLMREGDPSGVANLRQLLSRDRELTIERVQEIVRNHLYDNPEFRERFRELSEEEGEREASHQILDSIYKAFGYRRYTPAEEAFDACLMRNRQAHLVVTKALIRMRGVKD